MFLVGVRFIRWRGCLGTYMLFLLYLRDRTIASCVKGEGLLFGLFSSYSLSSRIIIQSVKVFLCYRECVWCFLDFLFHEIYQLILLFQLESCPVKASSLSTISSHCPLSQFSLVTIEFGVSLQAMVNRTSPKGWICSMLC